LSLDLVVTLDGDGNPLAGISSLVSRVDEWSDFLLVVLLLLQMQVLLLPRCGTNHRYPLKVLYSRDGRQKQREAEHQRQDERDLIDVVQDGFHRSPFNSSSCSVSLSPVLSSPIIILLWICLVARWCSRTCVWFQQRNRTSCCCAFDESDEFCLTSCSFRKHSRTSDRHITLYGN